MILCTEKTTAGNEMKHALCASFPPHSPHTYLDYDVVGGDVVHALLSCLGQHLHCLGQVARANRAAVAADFLELGHQFCLGSDFRLHGSAVRCGVTGGEALKVSPRFACTAMSVSATATAMP